MTGNWERVYEGSQIQAWCGCQHRRVPGGAPHERGRPGPSRGSLDSRDRPHAHAHPPWPRLSSQQPVGPVTTPGPGSAPGSEAAATSRGSRIESPAQGPLLRGRGGAPARLRPQPRWPPAVCDALSLPSRVHFSSLFGEAFILFFREGVFEKPKLNKQEPTTYLQQEAFKKFEEVVGNTLMARNQVREASILKNYITLGRGSTFAQIAQIFSFSAGSS
ncbi:hypothetical protein J1605_017432 [Eschrichtius robustus]|uniref:Uncharacterized protein n=1 Tax=Eschrichtius robustus TaxID=9764 RepID=A0AB34I0V4_ESCRO|nr:hypothetical protein J1605_017432 [Eschrichtius robustus]